MRKSQPIRVFSLIAVIILNIVFQSSLIIQLVSANPGTPIPPPRTGANLRELVEALNSTTPPGNRTDTDGDGMWDLVEAAIGTDFNNTDSDFDRLNDTFEVWNNLDPLDPDSNNDGLPDYHEVMNVSSPNVDGDNLDNAWDFDNDDDGVNDHIDLSPFSKSITSDRFHFEIKTNGNPLYIIFQLIPENPEHLKLFYQSWDWPDNDREGSMKDLDNSKQDVSIIPILNLTANVLPNQSDVLYYGILVTSNGVHVPLYPVFEYGTIVAFAGKMVYPASAPMDLTLDAELFWRVNGITDERAKALNTTSGKYFSLSVSGAVLANSSSITPLETFQWIDLGDNTIAMKALNGLYLSVADNGTVVANSIGINERESFELVSKGGDMIALKAYNGFNVSVAADGTVVANSTVQEAFQLIDMGVWPEATVLATYNDAFMLTGFSVQENYGSDLGLFYSEDVNQTFGANLLLAYDFLRNSTTHVSDMPPIIADYNLTLSALNGSFSHKDEAFQSMANEMTPDALNSLPGNRVLPVVAIVEDSFVGLDLSQIASGSYIAGNVLTADLTSEPIVTSKTLKTDWYNTSSHQVLEVDDIVTEIWSWGMNETLFANLIGLQMAWNTGEQTITSIGTSVTKFETPEVELVKKEVRKGVKATFGVFFKFVVAPSYRFIQSLRLLRNLKAAGWSISVKGSTSWLRIAKLQLKRAFNAKTILTSSSRIGNTIAVIGAFVEIGLAIYSLFSIGESLDWSPQGTHMALTKALLQTAYAVIMFNIAMIPYVGWLIALVWGIIDLFGDYSGKLIAWMMGIKVTGSVTPSIEIAGEPSVTTYDKDDNGLDVGDRIEYISRLKGKVSGRWDLVRPSGIFPYYEISAPPGSSSTTGYVYPPTMIGYPIYEELPISTSITKTENSSAGWKAYEYESGVWIEPGIGMPNFPVNIGIKAYYDLWYEWEHFVWLVFYWFYCQHKGWEEGYTSGGGFTLRFDVMPGNLTDFVSWRSITALDHDGDRLIDSEETKSDQWRFDTDADGLNDKYEVDIGTDPKQFDTDKDGLIDWFELVYNTNTTEPDTDGDGLQDFLEVAGWVISFNYTDDPAKPFTTRVYSDPRLPDTDRDGVDDNMEYLSGLNPRSKDTDGNGIDDVANPRIEATYLELAKQIEIPLGKYVEGGDYITDITIDTAGYIYVTDTNGRIYKFDPDLTLMSNQSFISPVSMRRYPSAVDSENGYVHFGDNTYSQWAPYGLGGSSISTFYLNGTQIDSDWGFKSTNCTIEVRGLDVDEEGNLYVLRRGYIYVPYYYPPYQEYFNDNVGAAWVDIYDSNRSPVDTWGSFGNSVYVYWREPPTGNVYSWYYRWSYDTAIDQFNWVNDIAADDANGYVYVSDVGATEDTYWIKYHYYAPLISSVKLRPDRVAVYSEDGTYVRSLLEFNNGSLKIEFNNPTGLEVDEQGYLYVCDSGNNRIHKFDSNGRSIASWEIPNTGSVAVHDQNLYTYTSYMNEDWYGYGVIYKFLQRMEAAPPFEDPVPDRDGDGLENTAESEGWDVTFTNTTGTFTIHVTSDPLLNDTDFEGLSDYNESQIKTHPRDPDTDDDGLSDYAEWRGFSPKTNPKHWDTDGDGLGDGAEISFGSDPTDNDTDDDGLSDLEEFELGSNPRDPDTDRDGAKDKKEKEAKSNLKDPDSDEDFMFDGMELNVGTDPTNNDTDNDRLPDGHEILFNTNPLNNDTDDDHLPDGLEVGMFLNPTSNDTDKDGVPDGTELEWGTNPWNNDTDGDGIPDNLDLDSNSTHVKNIILAFDPDPENATKEFADNLAQYTNVTIVSTEALLMNFTGYPHIVLVGRPDGNGAVGKLIKDLLSDTGDVLTKMIESDEDRLAVRYGIWDSTQTVVMLSHPYPLDHLRVLDILRSKTVTVLPDWVMVEYLLNTLVKYPSGGSLNHTEISYDFFKVDEIDTVKETDSIIMAVLEQAVNLTVTMTQYNTSTTPFNLTHASGLEPYDEAVGKYLNITLSKNVQNETAEIIESARIQMYYTESDLDRNGDGDVDDLEDLDETRMAMYFLNQSTGYWTKLTEDLNWVTDTGVNTTDIQLYGENYSGYAWADLTHFSLYGLAAPTFNRPPNVTGAYPSIECLWPPNHRYVDVTILGVTDPDGDNVTITVTGITSDEPTDGKHSPDAYGISTDTASLRAERLGTGNGRVYVITFVASDGKGGEAEGNVTVYVPHHKTGQTYVCIDDGQNYDATEATADDDNKPKTQTQAEPTDDRHETEEDNTDTESREPNEDSYQEEPANSSDEDENDDAPEGEEVGDKGQKSKSEESKDESVSGEDEDQNAGASDEDEEESGGEGDRDEGENGKVPEKEEEAKDQDVESEESKDKKSEDQPASGKGKDQNDEASDDNLEGEGAGVDDGKEKGGGAKGGEGNESANDYQGDDEKGVKDEKQSRDERKLEKETEKKPKKNSD